MTEKIRRKYYLDKLLSYKDKDIIKVVTGLRRSGKSTLLQIFRNDLSKNKIPDKQVQFYNFELPENCGESYYTYYDPETKWLDFPNYGTRILVSSTDVPLAPWHNPSQF